MDRIKHLYYINLDKRKDRNNHVIDKVLPVLKFAPEKTTRISAVDTTGLSTPHLRATGCTLSHLKIYKDAINNNYDHFMVIEDDFKPIVNSLEFKIRMEKLFDMYPGFDVCQIAFNDRYGTTEKIDDMFMRGKNIQTTCGYVICLDFCKKLIPVFEDSVKQLENGEPGQKYACDQVWKQFQHFDTWMLTRCGVQLNDYSDIEGRKVSYGC